MADVNINKFRASVVRDGSKPSSPGFIVSEGQDPVNPPGTNNYVPYSGATANVELGEYGVEAGFITLDTTPTNTPTDQGTIFWDADDETVDIVLNGYTMKIGEDLFYPVKNQTGSTIAKGVAVRFNGTVGASGRLLIAPFIADGSVPSSRFMGVTAEEILNGEDGKVLYFGRVRGINTNAFNEGDILYASTTVAGGYQTAIPVAPNNIVQVAAVVTKSATVGTIFVRPTLGSNINKDEGVKIVSVADKNLLQYQSGTSLWENKSLSQVLGGTSAQFVKGDGSLDSTTYGTGTVTSVGLSSATSGVTIGSTPITTSGTITLAIATASGSQNGLLSSTDWTTFNGKQNALTNPVTGTGTTNYLPKFTGSTTVGNSNLINDSSGNLGLGVTPSAWVSAFKAIQILNQASISAEADLIAISVNAFYDTSWKYIANGVATNYYQNNGNHVWRNSISGTAGNAISFTQAMSLFSSGNLAIGPTTDAGFKLDVNGTGRFSGALTSQSLDVISTSGVGSSTASGLARFITAGTSTGISVGQSNSARKLDLGSQFIRVTSDDFFIVNASANATVFENNGTERMRIFSNGNVAIGRDTDSGYKLAVRASGSTDTEPLLLCSALSGTVSHYFFSGINSTMNTADANFWVRRNGTTSRSINAAGTINASGADYAEYMLKAIYDNIEKGDIVGVNINGQLTNIFADSISFVVKSTDPSYVGGDTWFNFELPMQNDFKTKEEFDIAYEEFKVQREEARQKVDRIAFSGQIPCNVLNAKVGDYIIPINNKGKISGQAITNPTFEQYQISVGKVWKIMEDGRAWIAVKIG
jgi:hypothetical protein